MNIHIYNQTTSTNDLAREAQYHHADVIWAHHQSAGRGQRGNKWSSGDGENITFSVVLEPDGVVAKEQFLISQITALALHDTLSRYNIETRIKWTNDIYVGDDKVAGILIENNLQGGFVARSIVGVGLNINQVDFDPALPNPTSMRRQSGAEYDRREVLESVVEAMMEWYEQLRFGDEGRERIRAAYGAMLYRLSAKHTYRKADGELFEAAIQGVSPSGGLRLLDEMGATREYLFREVEFVIEGRDK